MSDMAVTQDMTFRTPNEVRARLAEAEGWLTDHGEYMATRARSTIDTLAWITGCWEREPLTLQYLEPTEQNMRTLAFRARSAEREARLAGDGMRATYLGVIDLTCDWYRRQVDGML